MREQAKIPPGVCAVLIDADGKHRASATAFGKSTPAGLDRAMMQKHEALDALARAMMRMECNREIAECVDTYEAGRIMATLCDRKGWRTVVFEIGGDS